MYAELALRVKCIQSDEMRVESPLDEMESRGLPFPGDSIDEAYHDLDLLWP